MPNPSSIAMEEDSADNDAVTDAFNEMFETSKSDPNPRLGCFAAPTMAAAFEPGQEFDIEIVPEGTPDAVIKLLEQKDEELMELELGFEMTAGIMTEACEALAEAEAISADLSKALGHIGATNRELVEQRGAAAGTALALSEAGARFFKARKAFDAMEASMLEGASGCPDRDVQDRITGEVAEADALLESILIKMGALEG